MNKVLRERKLPGGQALQIVQGDLTEEPVEAIVNAANAYLKHGGGVAGVISRKGGPRIQEESDAWVLRHGPVLARKPAYTGAGRLPFRYVIHAVGPVWDSALPEECDRELANAVRGSLERAESLGVSSLAMPAISTGIFGFPKERAAEVILQAIADYFDDMPGSGLKQVRLTLLDDAGAQIFIEQWDKSN